MNCFLKKKGAKALVILFVMIVLLIGAVTFYLNDYYHADMQRIHAFLPETNVTICQTDNGHFVLAPEDASMGLIFYPGGEI